MTRSAVSLLDTLGSFFYCRLALPTVSYYFPVVAIDFR